MEAETGKETQLLNSSLLKCAQVSEKLVIPLMILDIRPFASGITNCLIMLTNKNSSVPKEEKTVANSWLSTDEMRNYFAKTVNKSLVDDYEKTIQKSLEICSQTAAENFRIRLDTNFLPRQLLDKQAYDRLAWVDSLKIQLGIAEKRTAVSRKSAVRVIRQRKNLMRRIIPNLSPAMDPKENGALDEDSTFDTQSVFLLEEQAPQKFPVVQQDNSAKHNSWKTLRVKQETLQRQRNLERKARHAARWELKDPKVYDCKVDRRNRAKTRKPIKAPKLLKRQTSEKVTVLKSLKLEFARRKEQIVSTFSTHLAYPN